MAEPRIFRAEEANFLSNAYLIADPESGKGVLVDSNGATDPIAEVAEREGIEITHLLLTHHHYDHVVGAEDLAAQVRRRDLGPRADQAGGRRGHRHLWRGRRDHLGRARDQADLHARPLRRPPGAARRRHGPADGGRPLQGHRRRHRQPDRDRPRRPQGIDHVEVHGARPRDPRSTRATASPRRSAPSGRRTPSSASGAASRSRATIRSRSAPPTRPSASRRRCCSGAPTTTAATRR